MAKQKSRFPSYGLVRGPSHAQGGVAGVVAGKQPVELEGGEWVVPKEVVPDYLPQLVQMTNEGRAMQGMDNGNSAIDALIASSVMQNGVVSPKSPHYQEGGQVYDPVSESLVDQTYYTPEFRYSALKSGSDMMTMPRREEYGQLDDITAGMFDAIEAEEGKRSAYKEKHNIAAIGRSGKPIFYGPQGGIGENLIPPEERVPLPASSDRGQSGVLGKLGSLLKELNPWGKSGSFKVVDARKRGGPVYGYQEGGEVERLKEAMMRRASYGPLPGTLPKAVMERDVSKILEQAKLDSGRALPRKQQEMRSPEMYGPPVPADLMTPAPDTSAVTYYDIKDYGDTTDATPTYRDLKFGQSRTLTDENFKDLNLSRKQESDLMQIIMGQSAPDTSAQDTSGAALDSMLMQLMMRDVNQSVNPFTGDTMDFAKDSLQLLDRMRKSNIPRDSSRVIMQQGGMVESPQLMQDMSQDRRIKPLQPDRYVIKDDTPGGEGQREMSVPKLHSAYLGALGVETPLSKRQSALLSERGIPPQSMAPHLESLVGRVLIQRLGNEPQ